MKTDRREFLSKMVGNGAKLAGGTVLLSTGLSMLSAPGCGPNYNPNGRHPNITTPREVDVVEHTVERNEGILGLLRSEFRRGRTPKPRVFGRIAGYTTEDEFVMLGDGQEVQYMFRFFPNVFNRINPGFDANMDTQLRKGQKIKFPDFNGDGYIGDAIGEKCGTLVFTGTRDYRGNLVSKGVEYRPLR